MYKKDNNKEFSKLSDRIANTTVTLAFGTMIVALFFALVGKFAVTGEISFLMIIEFGVGNIISERMLSRELKTFQDKF